MTCATFSTECLHDLSLVLSINPRKRWLRSWWSIGNDSLIYHPRIDRVLMGLHCIMVASISGSKTEETSQSQGAFAAIHFSYGSTEEDTNPGTDHKLEGSCPSYRPPFPLPDSLLNNLPPSEKVHQIIARTAKFVSEHGGQSEIVLRVKQGNNPTFGFLMPDHHLHPYFRFLVENPNMLKTDAVSDKGALSLLGSVYGSAEDEDDAPTQPTPKGIEIEKKVPKEEEKEIPLPAGEKLVTAKKNPSIAKLNPSIAKVKVKEGTDNVGLSKPQGVMMEPSSVMKIAMKKIAEFIQRNGRELEAVLINQDRSTNNFPFLVPTNAYHPYYLKILEEAKEGKKSTERRPREPTPSSRSVSREPSEEPSVPEKFKMSFGKTKKPEKTEASNHNLRVGLTTQEAAAIVNAATRGVSPSYRPEPPKVDSEQGKSGPGSVKPSGIDEDWIAKTIAKTAALVSSEAASLSKEEKIKAERLKRAKMFASMIKSTGGGGSAPPLPQLLNKVESIKVEDDNGSRGNSEVGGGENREGDEVEKGESVREKKHPERNYRKRDDSLESERKRGKYSDEESFEESPGHEKKRHKNRHHGEPRKKNHSSSDEERERAERKRDRHSYKDRERHDRKRERRHHRKKYSSSDSEEESRHHRRSHRDEKNRYSRSYSSSDSEEDSRHHRRSHRDEKSRSSKRLKDDSERSSSKAEEKREDSADVPDELRAKIRAMLLQTL